MVQPHHYHHDGSKSTDEPSYNIFRDSPRKLKCSSFETFTQYIITFIHYISLSYTDRQDRYTRHRRCPNVQKHVMMK